MRGGNLFTTFNPFDWIGFNLGCNQVWAQGRCAQRPSSVANLESPSSVGSEVLGPCLTLSKHLGEHLMTSVVFNTAHNWKRNFALHPTTHGTRYRQPICASPPAHPILFFPCLFLILFLLFKSPSPPFFLSFSFPSSSLLGASQYASVSIHIGPTTVLLWTGTGSAIYWSKVGTS